MGSAGASSETSLPTVAHTLSRIEHSMVAQAFNPTMPEPEAGGGVLGQPGLPCSEALSQTPEDSHACREAWVFMGMIVECSSVGGRPGCCARGPGLDPNTS